MSRGFTLIELMIVVSIIAIVAAIAIPSLLTSKQAANESAAIANLRLLTSVQAMYVTRYGTYATLAQLCNAGYIDSTFGSGTKQDYFFTAGTLSSTTWCMKTEPNDVNAGSRSFRTGVDGVVYEKLDTSIGWGEGTALGS